MKPEFHSNCFSYEEAIIFKTNIPYLFQLNLIQYIFFLLFTKHYELLGEYKIILI